MTRILLTLILISLLSCETLEINDASNILGRWEIESVNFRVDGKEYEVDPAKLYEASMNQLVWEIKENNRIDEVFGGKAFAQNYEYLNSENKITITGYKFYPRIFHLQTAGETLTAMTPEINDPHTTSHIKVGRKMY
ncbi:hypothetical protein [Jiulongibacter sediminis]|jgi:hypothetical protein|uniref:hypothetical protein n=1 Tax=Jiulongibacter sediminis TaxID=1605367 RepID=UPI0026EAE478|nr:hypothetical protein [Jiulongibacter sediminis]